MRTRQKSSERWGERSMSDVTTDTTLIVKGLIPPRRKKRDAIYDEYLNLL